jgi:hypothetical protein
MGVLSDYTGRNEPLVGYLIGHPYLERAWPCQDKKRFILADDYQETRLNLIRSLVLRGCTARFPERAEGGTMAIKEPRGSLGVPLLMKALPENRTIFLLRNPRDVTASALRISFVTLREWLAS